MPDINMMVGKSWKVTMLDGNWFVKQFMNVMGDKKVFLRSGEKIVGYNILAGFIKWGYFTATIDIDPQNFSAIKINYDQPRNIFSINIRDYIRFNPITCTFIGLFCVIKNGEVIKKGHFLLTNLQTIQGGTNGQRI